MNKKKKNIVDEQELYKNIAIKAQDKNIFFVTFEPDTDNICLHKYNPDKIGGFDLDDKKVKNKNK